ncbi:unnamed protein product [Nesidiocoris tenuis]|uniref:Uncharacterized protein n=1 Tax=Nesidiocoris tenuis TaxID=355587 RepID=A0A6H5G021_9HEMI|nr:unnamed protein product [Nesidiocoris tenuis]
MECYIWEKYGSESAEKDGIADHSLRTIVNGQETRGHLGDHVPPEESTGDGTLLFGIPIDCLNEN